MSNSVVQVPHAMLLDQALSASAKLVWMVQRLRPAWDRTEIAGLCARSGLTPPTARKCIAELQRQGWTGQRDGPSVPVPSALLTDHKIGIQGRVIYGLLLLTPGFRHPAGRFAFEDLARLAGISRNTVARALDELAQAEWIRLERSSRLAPVRFELTFPGLTRSMNAQAAAASRLDMSEHYGEGLMREYLSLLIDSNDYFDNVGPGFLVNPRTLQQLRFDRFYPPKVAFEFNGPQHYRATAKFGEHQVAIQRERDYIKLGICVSRGIDLLVVHPEDLTLQGMQRKIGPLLPQRDIAGYELLIDYLEDEGRRYRKSVARI